MWLTDYVTRNSIESAKTQLGSITQSDTKKVSVDADLEHRDIKIVAPFGIAYNPPIQAKSVVIPVDKNAVCIGVETAKKELNPGEVMLFSSGGASIVLKNNGDVIINGKVYTA